MFFELIECLIRSVIYENDKYVFCNIFYDELKKMINWENNN